jgi:hypothetical protein
VVISLSYNVRDMASPRDSESTGARDMRELVERTIGDARRVRVNVAESPLGWLKARGMVDARQFEAGERLRGDYETAALGPRVTMRWSARVDGGAGEGLDPTTAQVAAKRRFDAALDAAGKGLSDIAWRTICAGEALPVAEKALGWPVRSGRLVLTLALDRLADHYRLA